VRNLATTSEEKTNMGKDNFNSEVVLLMVTTCEGDPVSVG